MQMQIFTSINMNFYIYLIFTRSFFANTQNLSEKKIFLRDEQFQKDKKRIPLNLKANFQSRC